MTTTHDVAATDLELRTVTPTQETSKYPERLPVGPIGRLGRWTAGHFRIVAAAWVVVAVGLGVFAPRAEQALSGAGWEATGSESVHARKQIDKNFHGFGSYGLTVVVHARDRSSPTRTSRACYAGWKVA